MSIKIINPQEDQYGNSKENIFLAFDETEKFLGSSYAYSTINFHQTHETPYLIMINVSCADDLELTLKNVVRQKLFDKVLSRARELREQRADLKARIYAGFEYNRDKLDFYITNGFDPDYSIIMEADIPTSFTYTLPKNVRVQELKISSDKEFLEYKSMYDEIFVTPLDRDVFIEQESERHFKNLSFFSDDKLEGGCTIFEKDGLGYVETLFVLPEKRGQGLSKCIVKYILNYFLSIGIDKTRLEVWNLNKRAVKLYQSFGYHEMKKSLMFPGITL
ncbi:GNAT family N-acetyltransferase [Sporolactobacillus shoreae]|uniref:GNAT family N-acetyltransferase n=1 Tax=Sporolactobacillus shoreae TaxID=1465501 RepID=A0A4Z0GME5_9BACL|nr:GNAT family N-acetyltransferase [Sporolactobacillus shoreae]TGA97682.1 GNAT family N-acetyltransferase [Sporolactobacillus shoreae]